MAVVTEDVCLPYVSRLPKDQDCHELWSRMMKKALRERLAPRPSDEHGTAVDTRNSSSKITAAETASHNVTTASTHNGSSIYSKNSLPVNSSHSIVTVSSDLNLAGLAGQRRSWTSSQHAAGHHDKSAVHASSSSSLLTNDSDSSYLTHRPAVTRHFDLRHVVTSSSQPTANYH